MSMNPTPQDTPQAVAEVDSRGNLKLALELVSAALVECQGKIKSAHMDAQNPFFKSKYATLGAIIESSREALYASGLAMQQIPTIKDGNVTVQTVIRHKSGQWLDGGTMTLPLEGNDRNSDAQIAGSICTYLKRYSWASNLGIYADEDDDGTNAPKGAVARKTPLQASGAATPQNDSEVAKWAKLRLKLLNKLEAAPGQRNRVLLTDYLTSEGVLTFEQTLEDLPTTVIPTTPEAMDKLLAGMQNFDMQRQAEHAQQDLREELI